MTLEQGLTIAKVLFGIVAVGIIGYIVWYNVFRPKSVMKNSKPSDHSGLKKMDSSKMIPVKDIKNGFITVDGEYRFIRSMKTTGHDLFLAEVEDQARTELAYQQFFRTVQFPITFRIDSSSCDLSFTIGEHQKALQRIENEYGEAVTQFSMLEQAFQNAETDQAKHDILYEMYQADKHVTAYENAIKHLEQQIAFLEEHNGGEKNPIIEQRYLYDWSYNPDDFPNDQELIEKRANNELGAMERAMADALPNAGVKASRDDDNAMFDLCFRHYHPYAGLIYREHNQTDYEEKLNRGRAYYDVNAKKYKAIKQDPIIVEQFKKLSEEEKQKEVKEEVKEVREVVSNREPDIPKETAGNNDFSQSLFGSDDEEGGINL